MKPFTNIFHTPILPEEQARNYVAQWTKENVRYVCSSAIGKEETVWDIYYGDTYHGVALLEKDGELSLEVHAMDHIEDFAFIMVKDENENYRYSTSREDKIEMSDGSYISGGRTCPVFEGSFEITYLEKGEFIKCL